MLYLRKNSFQQFNHSSKSWIGIFCVLMLLNINSYAQLTSDQETIVKKTAQSFFLNMEHLATGHKDDAFKVLVDLFGDVVNKKVHNDLKPGKTMIPFMEYLDAVRTNQGSLEFNFKNRE